MKTYVIILSTRFPAWHNRAGDQTFFAETVGNALTNAEATLTVDEDEDTHIQIFDRKLHTIRANYTLWEKRIAEVERGEACLSLRIWSGTPYRSKQVEIARLTKADGVGIQRLEMTNDFVEGIINGKRISYPLIASNDGLSAADWIDWFNVHELAHPMAIIHFTKFRY